MNCNGCGKAINPSPEPVAKCAACKAQYHPACTKTKAGDSPTQCCPSCEAPVQWEMPSSAASEKPAVKITKTSPHVERVKSSWMHKIVKIGIQEVHTVEAKYSIWTNLETIRIDGAPVLNHTAKDGAHDVYRFRIGEAEPCDVIVTFGNTVAIEAIPPVAGAAMSGAVQGGPMMVSQSTNVTVNQGGGGCLGCGCSLMIAFLGVAASVLLAAILR